MFQALTGGTLLARDKEFITLYRGKDFLPQAVQAALQERDSITKALQEEEERARGRSRSTTMELADAPSENRCFLNTDLHSELFFDSDSMLKNLLPFCCSPLIQRSSQYL
jgi:hypothetical protein